DEFKKLTSCQNTQKIDLGQCLLNSFKAGKTLDVLIEGLKQKKELHLDISVYKKGSKTNWKVRSFPFAYAEGDGPCLQITWFIDESYQSMRNAYWDLQVHVNMASAEIIRKGAELNNVNIRLQEINEKLELEISERKKVEEELARLKHQYELILSSAAEGILGLNLQGNHMFVNPAAARMLGYEAKELIGCRSHSTWHHTKPDGSPYPAEECKIYAAYRDGVEYRSSADVFWRKNGTSFPVEYMSMPIYEQERLVGAVLTFTDITERKRAEEALRESENKYRKIFENVQDIFYQADNEGKIIDISPSIERYSGYPRGELVGKPVAEVYFNPEDRIRLLKAIREKGEVVDYELRLKSKDNRLIYASANAHILFDLAGKPIGVEGTLRDITERKRAEEELQKLAAVVRYSSELINLTTLDGKMVFLNEAGAKMLGISPAEIEQTNFMQIIPDHLKEKVQNELLPALMNNGTWEGDLQYLNLKTGQLTDVHTMSFMIKDAVTGAPLFLANVSLDITEQKELEAALHKAKEEAERANRAKTIFLANMSHEIRTPMNAILGFSQLMQRDPTVTPRQRQQLDTINRSGEHLLALINDIL
ncbi:PAS domain S-box protein, partial [Candidatus Bathyarchaeota archaeon]|nr:PAS domain S-box protein [Candidatus Bathyarchaeota archaeon]